MITHSQTFASAERVEVEQDGGDIRMRITGDDDRSMSILIRPPIGYRFDFCDQRSLGFSYRQISAEPIPEEDPS